MVRFKMTGEENTYIIAWTTTPWTLPSNQALCVNPDSEYSKVKAEDGNIYIAATALIGDIVDGEVEILAKYKGKELEGIEYDQLFPKAGAVPNGQKCNVITSLAYIIRSYTTFDQHQLVAAVAPRLFYTCSAEDDTWADPESEYLSCMLADEAYKRLNKSVITSYSIHYTKLYDIYS